MAAAAPATTHTLALLAIPGGARRNDIMNRVNWLILYVLRITPFRSGLDGHLIRGAMVFTFFAFSIQKWNHYTAEMLVPLISHSPVVFWLLPAFGVQGAAYFLGTTETIFGFLIFLGYWSPRLGIFGALGSIVTFIGTTSIIPFLPNGWAHEAGGFPIMTLPLGFLLKDVLFLAVSFYLLKHDLTRTALEITSKLSDLTAFYDEAAQSNRNDGALGFRDDGRRSVSRLKL
jgi:uncharacterized membrane protein YkgB